MQLPYLPPKRLFLLDSIGALFSAFLLGIVLVNLDQYFHMPQAVLYKLALIAFVFFIYSSTCWLWLKKDHKKYLRIIAVANLLYSCLTLGLMLYWRARVTTWDFLYFTGEILIIFFLARLEWQTARRQKSTEYNLTKKR